MWGQFERRKAEPRLLFRCVDGEAPQCAPVEGAFERDDEAAVAFPPRS